VHIAPDKPFATLHRYLSDDTADNGWRFYRVACEGLGLPQTDRKSEDNHSWLLTNGASPKAINDCKVHSQHTFMTLNILGMCGEAT
jgi:hypothetical protein